MSPFVTPLDIANEVVRRRQDLPAGEVYSPAEWHAARTALVKAEQSRSVGCRVFVRRKGPKLHGRLHTFQGKIIALDGAAVHIEYHSILGKHLEWFYPNEALLYICERSSHAVQVPQALRG